MKFEFELSQRTANRLMALYREMDLVAVGDFLQDDCECCVIGHGIRAGLINGYTDAQQDFHHAIAWIGLPSLSDYDNGWLDDYLFGMTFSMERAAKVLGLPAIEFQSMTSPKDAQKRIVTILEAGGYDVVWNR